MKMLFHSIINWFKRVRRFSAFTPRAQRTLAFAHKEAFRLNHNYVGTEHILLGLIKVEDGVARKVLQKNAVSSDDVKIAVERYVGCGPIDNAARYLPYTPRVKSVLGLAYKEAKKLGQSQIDTEHILLALLREDKGVAVRVMKGLGMTLEQTRLEVLNELDPNISP